MRLFNSKFLLTLTLSVGIMASQFLSTSVEAKKQSFHCNVSADIYQRAITKNFLGRSYGTGKGQYVCNTYVGKALENIAAKAKASESNIKDLHIMKGKSGAPTSYDWTAFHVNYTYKENVYNESKDTYQWNSKKTTSQLKKKNKGTKLSKLSLGDVLTYGSSGGHVALYFGKYADKEAVADRLVELGVYKRSDLRKSSDRYSCRKNGRAVIREYPGCGNQWRVHATCHGLLIDNAIVSKSSNGTSSFGKWKKTIPSGYTTAAKKNTTAKDKDKSKVEKKEVSTDSQSAASTIVENPEVVTTDTEVLIP